MQNFYLETHIGADGVLHLDLPVDGANMDMKVTVTCRPLLLPVKKGERRTIRDVIQLFRNQLDQGDLEPDEDVYADVRDRSPGREIIF